MKRPVPAAVGAPWQYHGMSLYMPWRHKGLVGAQHEGLARWSRQVAAHAQPLHPRVVQDAGRLAHLHAHVYAGLVESLQAAQ